MKRLLIFLKGYEKESFLAPLFKMLEATFELLVPLVVAQIIDTGIAGNNGPYLWKMGGLLIVLGVVGFAFSLTAQYFAAKSAVSAGMAMRSDLFAHINDPFRPQWTVGLKLNLPPEYVLIHRVWLGGIGVLCQLGGRIAVLDVLEDHLPEFSRG